MSALEKPQGMLLITGPTGSGKTVSLYTGLNILNTEDTNISTAEDPVEINLEGINQVNVNPKTGLTFSAALKAFYVKILMSSWSVRFVIWKQLKLQLKQLKQVTW